MDPVPQKEETEIKLLDNSEVEEFVKAAYDSSPPLDDIRVYLNVCLSDKVLGVFNRKGELLKHKEDYKEWGKIPMSFSEQRSSLSLGGVKRYHYDCHINKDLFQAIVKSTDGERETRLRMMVNMIIYNFEQRVVKSRFKLAFKWKEGGAGIRLLKEKKYRGDKPPYLKSPPPHVINRGMAIEDYEQFREKFKTLDKSSRKTPSDILSKEPEKKQEQKIIIPSESKPKLVGGIEVVKEKPKYVISTEGNIATVVISMQEETSFSGIELDVSEKRIRVVSENYELQITVEELCALMISVKEKKEARIDGESTRAKFKSKKGELRITATVIN